MLTFLNTAKIYVCFLCLRGKIRGSSEYCMLNVPKHVRKILLETYITE